MCSAPLSSTVLLEPTDFRYGHALHTDQTVDTATCVIPPRADQPIRLRHCAQKAAPRTRTLPREASPDACTGTRHLSRPLTSMLLAEGSLTGTAARRCAHSIQKGRGPGGAAHHPERCAPGGQDAGGAGRRSMDPSWCPPHRSGRRATGIMAWSHPGEVSIDDTPTTGHAPLPPTGAHAPGRQSSESSSGWSRSPSSSSPAPPRPGPTKLGTEIAEVLTLGAAHGTEPLLAALERAVTFGRWRADDVRPVHGRRRPCTPSDIGWSGAGVDVAVGADQVLGRLPDRHRCRGR